MDGNLLHAAILLAAGAAGAMAARALRLPIVAGAMVAPLIGLPAGLPAGAPLTALLCFCLGASIDPATLLRRGPALLGLSALAVPAVTLLACAAGRLAGLPWQAALMLGAAMAAASPVPLVAVLAGERARGRVTQGALAGAPISIVAASILAFVFAHDGRLLLPIPALLAGCLAGGVILVPLSRLTRRGGIVSAVLLGAILLVAGAATSGGGDAGLAVGSIAAGFVAVNFIPSRVLVREALRDLVVPASVVWAAWAVARPSPGELIEALPAALLLTAARFAGLTAAAAIRDGRKGWLQAATLLPASPLLVLLPLVTPALLSADPAAAGVMSLAAAATLLSAIAGMPLAALALRRAGEAAGEETDPDAWRAAMR